MTTEQRTSTRRTPPPWLNTLMTWMLRTPGLQRLVGRGTALVTFIGAKSGKQYTTPISYRRDGESITFTSSRARRWWRNFESQPRVQLRLAGVERGGTARILHDEEALTAFMDLVRAQKVVARVNGVSFDSDGRPNREECLQALEATVMVAVDLDPLRR